MFTLTSSNGNRSLKMRLILAPPDNSLVLTSSESEPVIALSKSLDISCNILDKNVLILIKLCYSKINNKNNNKNGIIFTLVALSSS